MVYIYVQPLAQNDVLPKRPVRDGQTYIVWKYTNVCSLMLFVARTFRDDPIKYDMVFLRMLKN